jgi:hypothetical protein
MFRVGEGEMEESKGGRCKADGLASTAARRKKASLRRFSDGDR